MPEARAAGRRDARRSSPTPPRASHGVARTSKPAPPNLKTQVHADARAARGRGRADVGLAALPHAAAGAQPQVRWVGGGAEMHGRASLCAAAARDGAGWVRRRRQERRRLDGTGYCMVEAATRVAACIPRMWPTRGRACTPGFPAAAASSPASSPAATAAAATARAAEGVCFGGCAQHAARNSVACPVTACSLLLVLYSQHSFCFNKQLSSRFNKQLSS